MTFLIDKRLQLIRASTSDGNINLDWSKQILNTFEQNDIAPLLNFMFANPYDQDELWLGGMYDRRGSIIRFNKEIGIAIGGYRFKRMNEINAFESAHDLEGETMFICGT